MLRFANRPKKIRMHFNIRVLIYMKSAQLIVWGVILIVIGLGLGGWGGLRSYSDINDWVSARAELKNLESMTPEKLEKIKQEAKNSSNFVDGFFGALLSPELLDVAKTKDQELMSEANQKLYSDIPLTLFGLMMLGMGNRMLARSKST